MSSHRRVALFPALVAVAALVLTGCGSDGGSITATGEPQASDSGSSGSSGSDSSTGSEDSSDSGSTGSEDSSDLSVPDLGDLPGDTGPCIALGLTLGATAAGAIGLGSDADVAQMREQLEQYQDQVPEELRDDLKIMEDAFTAVAEEGIMAGGEALSAPEVEEAQANIEAYMNENCGGAGI